MDVVLTDLLSRLSIEKQCLQQYLEIITEDTSSTIRRYKEYAFLREEEKVVPLIKYLYTLSAVNFLCFTASFPKISMFLLYQCLLLCFTASFPKISTFLLFFISVCYSVTQHPSLKSVRFFTSLLVSVTLFHSILPKNQYVSKHPSQKSVRFSLLYQCLLLCYTASFPEISTFLLFSITVCYSAF